MKKLLVIILIAGICSCAKKMNSDIAIHKLQLLYDTGKPETLVDGDILYRFSPTIFRHDSIIYISPALADRKIKGCFDQGLGILPQHEDLSTSVKIYEWETLTEKVHVENLFELSSTKNELHLRCKIYISKKL